MTTLSETGVADPQEQAPDDGRPEPAPPTVPPGHERRPLTPRRIGLGLAGWVAASLLGVVLTAVTLGALAESRSQHRQLAGFRASVRTAAAVASSPFGAPEPTAPPAEGAPVALLQMPTLRLQRVVAEGAEPEQTQGGPGHVPGTAGVGQPGNAGVVGRSSTYGTAFDTLDRLRPGDPIVATTAQGQSVYTVDSVRVVHGGDPLAPSRDDRLTLVTDGSWFPFGSRDALVVTATMTGRPFPPLPQGARSAATDGRSGDASALPLAVIWGVLFAAAAAGSVFLYRRWLARSTYLLSTPVLVALLVLLTDSVTRLLPAWT